MAGNVAHVALDLSVGLAFEVIPVSSIHDDVHGKPPMDLIFNRKILRPGLYDGYRDDGMKTVSGNTRYSL